MDPTKNHGRYAASDYSGCLLITIPHAELKVGMPCPECSAANTAGKLYTSKSREIVRLQGSPLITGTRYVIENLRCSLCGESFSATLPPAVANCPKYDETCCSAIAIARYYSGQPFKRSEYLQAAQGIPLADATQWEQVFKLYSRTLKTPNTL